MDAPAPAALPVRAARAKAPRGGDKRPAGEDGRCSSPPEILPPCTIGRRSNNSSPRPSLELPAMRRGGRPSGSHPHPLHTSCTGGGGGGAGCCAGGERVPLESPVGLVEWPAWAPSPSPTGGAAKSARQRFFAPSAPEARYAAQREGVSTATSASHALLASSSSSSGGGGGGSSSGSRSRGGSGSSGSGGGGKWWPFGKRGARVSVVDEAGEEWVEEGCASTASPSTISTSSVSRPTTASNAIRAGREATAPTPAPHAHHPHGFASGGGGAGPGRREELDAHQHISRPVSPLPPTGDHCDVLPMSPPAPCARALPNIEVYSLDEDALAYEAAELEAWGRWEMVHAHRTGMRLPRGPVVPMSPLAARQLEGPHSPVATRPWERQVARVLSSTAAAAAAGSAGLEFGIQGQGHHTSMAFAAPPTSPPGSVPRSITHTAGGGGGGGGGPPSGSPEAKYRVGGPSSGSAVGDTHPHPHQGRQHHPPHHQQRHPQLHVGTCVPGPQRSPLQPLRADTPRVGSQLLGGGARAFSHSLGAAAATAAGGSAGAAQPTIGVMGVVGVGIPTGRPVSPTPWQASGFAQPSPIIVPVCAALVCFLFLSSAPLPKCDAHVTHALVCSPCSVG